MRSLPREGWTQDQIDRQLSAFYDSDPPRRKTSMSVGTHYVSHEIQEVLRRAHNQFSDQYDMVLLNRAGAREMERDVLEISANLLSSGRPGVVANMAWGGTEAAFNAMQAARTRARRERPWVVRPEVVMPASAHPAFTKVASYLDLTVRRAPLTADHRCDIAAVESLIGTDTIALVGSAPDWPFGYFDDIVGLGRLAIEHDLWFHVDGVVGGFVAPFAAEVGEPIPAWDLSVPGVSTVAAGLGTWGYAMKPIVVVAWRDPALLEHSISVVDDWPGNEYITSGFGGSRPVGPIAAAWAVLHHLGRAGYQLQAEHLIDGRRVFADRLAQIPGVELIEPGLVTLNYRHATMPVEAIIARMARRGWTHFSNDEPALVSLMLDPSAIDVMDEYLTDLASILVAGPELVA